MHDERQQDAVQDQGVTEAPSAIDAPAHDSGDEQQTQAPASSQGDGTSEPLTDDTTDESVR